MYRYDTIFIWPVCLQMCLCVTTVLASVGTHVCVCVYSFSISGLLILALRSDHMRVELCNNYGDVIAVHASQLFGQRQHF